MGKKLNDSGRCNTSGIENITGVEGTVVETGTSVFLIVIIRTRFHDYRKTGVLLFLSTKSVNGLIHIKGGNKQSAAEE